MNRNRFISLILILLLCGLTACAANVPIPGPDPDEVELDPDVVDISEGGSGTAILNYYNGVEIGTSFIIFDESFTIYISPVLGSREQALVTGETEGLYDVSITGTGTVGSHTLTGKVPATITVDGMFYPYPRCAFELHFTLYLAFSEVTSIESSIVGTIPGNLGEDTVDFLPKITLSGPNYYYPVGDAFVVSIDNVLLEGDTGCTFLFNE